MSEPPDLGTLKWKAKADLLIEALERVAEGDGDAVEIARAALYEFDEGKQG